MLKFSEDITKFLNSEYPNIDDIEKLSIEELRNLKEDIVSTRQKYTLLEAAHKDLGNSGYGAAASPYFYFFNPAVAADITGECRNLTKTIWANLENWFKEELWNRKDLWEKFEFALDESKHDWYRNQPVSIYSDTDSVYTTYGSLFECFTQEYKEKYNTPDKKINWILKYNKEFQDNLNKIWCNDIYEPRHGKSIHNFELETISRAGIYLKKKKYLKALSYSKGKFYNEPKISGTGIELIKTTTPKLCREILTELVKSLVFETTTMSKEDYIYYFLDKLNNYKKKFYAAPIEDISQSVGIGDYDTYVIDDTDEFNMALKCPVSVKAIARFNYLAHKNNEDNKRVYSGKIKYYNIRLSHKSSCYFGYPIGELPTWAPPVALDIQWTKTIIEPINRFLEVMNIPLVNSDGSLQLDLFGGLF